MMAMPLILLYEIGILGARLFGRKSQDLDDEDENLDEYDENPEEVPEDDDSADNDLDDEESID